LSLEHIPCILSNIQLSINISKSIYIRNISLDIFSYALIRKCYCLRSKLSITKWSNYFSVRNGWVALVRSEVMIVKGDHLFRLTITNVCN